MYATRLTNASVDENSYNNSPNSGRLFETAFDVSLFLDNKQRNNICIRFFAEWDIIMGSVQPFLLFLICIQWLQPFLFETWKFVRFFGCPDELPLPWKLKCSFSEDVKTTSYPIICYMFNILTFEFRKFGENV